MTNRAHHPADRDSGEFANEERLAPAVTESGSAAVEEVISREYALPVEPAEAAASGDDDDAEEVIPEPDSIDLDPAVAGPAGESETATVNGEPLGTEAARSQPEAVDRLDPGPVEAPPTPAGSKAAASKSPASNAATSKAPASKAPASTAAASTAAASTAGGAAARAGTPGGPDAARRIAPPLPPPMPEELEVMRGAFAGPSAVEVTADELASAASSPARSEPGKTSAEGKGAKRSSSRPPFVDEVVDPVTPYEKRVSETVKVADLPPVEQLRGRVLANRYLAEEVAEHTAFSISYRAYHLALDQAVTVRVLLRGLACADEACQEVRRVAAAATALEHPHIAATLDFGILSDGWPYVVTEHFQGSTLSAILASEGKFVLRRVLHIGKQVAQGLSAAHEKDILHGLLTPDNVLVVDPGSSAEVAKILGYGISKARGAVPGPPRSGVFGVPFYVSPEQAACRTIDARSDIYSFGVLLYELMTGAPPFSDGDFAGVLCQHLDDDAPPPSSRLPSAGALAKALDAIIERCLRKEPEKRYQTAAELTDDLTRLEAAAARTKRRPMPEVQKPTTTIHSPHRKADAPEAPGAKVIVHDDVDEPQSPEAPEAAARRSSPSLTRSSPSAAGGAPSANSPASSPGAARSSRPPVTPVPAAPQARPPRVRVDQATIKISAVDRERLLNERPSHRSSWLASVFAAIRRLLAAEGGRRDDTR